jgi:hypothetical protein
MMTDEASRKNRIEHKKSELDYVKTFLTFCSIVVAIEVFIIGNPNFNEFFKNSWATRNSDFTHFHGNNF